MPALVHNSFRISNAKQFKESFSELADFGIGAFVPTSSSKVTKNPDGSYNIDPTATLADLQLSDVPVTALDDNIYLFIGRVTAWNQNDVPVGTAPDPNINENEPPNPIDSVKYGNYGHWDDMIAAKKVRASDVSHVIKREIPSNTEKGIQEWTEGLTYDEYDDREPGLFDDSRMHHTVNSMFRVYKCIKRGIGEWKTTAITNSPGGKKSEWTYTSKNMPAEKNTNAGISDDFMVPNGDGYQWKFLYTIPAGEALKFVTTSYIPVRTIRQDNGYRFDDKSEQYEVESNAEANGAGAIANVIMLNKTVVTDTNDDPVGYSPDGGDSYVQLRADGLNVAVDFNTSNVMTVSFQTGDISQCAFPANHANNKFDFTNAGLPADVLANTAPYSLEGYGVILEGNNSFPVTSTAGTHADAHKYVYPISGHSHAGGTTTLTIDPDFVHQLQAAAVIPNAAASVTGPKLQIHPKVDILANHDSTTGNGRKSASPYAKSVVNSFQAYAIAEPTYDDGTDTYNQTSLGRVIDVAVLNGGLKHARIDETFITPDVTQAPFSGMDAKVHACLPPVGGHGFDPVAELGGYNVMINARFEGAEGGEFSVGNEFRKIGILKNPMKWDASNDALWMRDAQTNPAHYADRFANTKADQCYSMTLGTESFYGADGTANTANTIKFESDMRVNWYEDAAMTGDVVASATVVDQTDDMKTIRFIEPRGDWDKVFANVLATDQFYIRSVSTHSVLTTEHVVANTADFDKQKMPGMKPGSGQILYLENRTTVSRSSNQSEDLKISVQF